MAKYYNYSEQPVLTAEPRQRWIPTTSNPYPMNFVQAPSADHQIIVSYGGESFLQGLHPVKGPQMFPINNRRRSEPIYSSRSAIVYPTTHSIPGPFLQSYISLPKRVYGY